MSYATQSAAEIVEHHRALVKSRAELRAAVERHARILRALDPECAEALELYPLADPTTPRPWQRRTQ